MVCHFFPSNLSPPPAILIDFLGTNFQDETTAATLTSLRQCTIEETYKCPSTSTILLALVADISMPPPAHLVLFDS